MINGQENKITHRCYARAGIE